MSADVAELRALAQTTRSMAGEVRTVAGELRAALGVAFESDAAERYRTELRGQATWADGVAGELIDASAALLQHAAAVEHRLAQIAAAEHWFMARLRDAEAVIARAGDAAGDAAGGALSAAERDAQGVINLARRMPGSGSLDWESFAGRL